MKYLLVVFLSFSSAQLFAQRLWGDIYLGVTNYQGELQDKSFTFQQGHFAGGAGATYNLDDHFAIRGRILFGKLSGDDKYTVNKARNLNFSTNLLEFQAGVQYNLFSLEERPFTPYVFAGLALFHFNPYTYDNTDAKYFLKPLSTEGQGIVAGRKEYSLTQVAIPFGGGVKLALSDNLNVGAEIGLRKTFTDYIDDVSTTYIDRTTLLTAKGPKAVELAFREGEIDHSKVYPADGTRRGFSKNKDWYFFSGLTLSFRINKGANIFESSGDRRMRQFNCPVF